MKAKQKRVVVIAVAAIVVLLASAALLLFAVSNTNRSYGLVVKTFQNNILGAYEDGEERYDVRIDEVIKLKGDICTLDVEIKVVGVGSDRLYVSANGGADQAVTSQEAELELGGLNKGCSDAGKYYKVRYDSSD
jgi:hypothetical protein